MLICSYEFGRNQCAEGVCTWRLAQALSGLACPLQVIASPQAESLADSPATSVKRIDDQPGLVTVAKWLKRWLDYDLEPGWCWRQRVARLPLDEEVDVIYGRGMPVASIFATAALARRWHRPFGLHFSDPYPSVWDPRDRHYRAKLNRVRRLMQRAAFVTFVTESARQLVAKEQAMDLRQKSFLLPHIAPAPVVFLEPPKAPDAFLYAGRFYGHRRPDRLLEGFARLCREIPGVEFRYVGPDHELVGTAAARLGIESRTRLLPFTKQIQDHYAAAQVLVATDASEPPAIFLTTKLVEYLNTNRKILLISPEDSPGSQLVGRFPQTAMRVPEDAAAIHQAMRQLLQWTPSPEDYAQRQQAMNEFSGSTVAARLLEELSRRIA
jgi:glycosyltransferase involved in cell wall biosynthesis